MEVSLRAYDFVLAFQFLCLPKEVRHWNILTLWRKFSWVPAQWVRRDNRDMLVLPARHPWQDHFLKNQQAASKVRPVI